MPNEKSDNPLSPIPMQVTTFLFVRHMLISLSFSEEHDYPNRLPGFSKQCTSMICDDDDHDPGLPPHAHALSVRDQSDSEAGYNIPSVRHMLISLSFSEEHDYPNRLPGFSKQCTSMICDDDDMMVQDTDLVCDQ